MKRILCSVIVYVMVFMAEGMLYHVSEFSQGFFLA